MLHLNNTDLLVDGANFLEKHNATVLSMPLTHRGLLFQGQGTSLSYTVL